MKTIFMGTPEFAIPSLETVYKNTDLKLIFTKEDKRNARGNKIIYSPVKQFGLDNKIEIMQPKRMKDEEVISRIKEINPDLIVVVAYGKIIPREIIDIPKYGIINVHSSLLPKYRGASPIHSAILNGDTETGVSIMYIEEELDAGDVILKEYCEISEEDTLGTLHDRLKELGAIGLGKALKLIEEEKVQAEKQDETKVSFVKPITKEQTRINWNDAKEVIYNQIRGLNPFPLTPNSPNVDKSFLTCAEVVSIILESSMEFIPSSYLRTSFKIDKYSVSRWTTLSDISIFFNFIIPPKNI